MAFVVFGALAPTLLQTVLLRQHGKVFALSLLALSLHRRNASHLLDFHLSGERADEQLDDDSGKLDGSARAVEIISRRRRGA
ncbi:MAG: hypothetical protein ACRD8U_00595 [Pyrinomonadaceae bacterium]